MTQSGEDRITDTLRLCNLASSKREQRETLSTQVALMRLMSPFAMGRHGAGLQSKLSPLKGLDRRGHP